MKVGENIAYLNLLLFYKGLKTEEEIRGLMGASPLDTATIGHGLAVWLLTHGRQDEALALMENIVNLDHWPAFGFIAAEVELARRKKES